jgi:hypothetical protein
MEGLSMFTNHLEEIKQRIQDRLPHDFITDNAYSVELADDIKIEIKYFENKSDFIIYLYPYVKRIRIDNLYYRSTLWSWLAAAFFDTLCPQLEDGSRKVESIDRYILNTNQWNRYYRHLIASPLRLYHEVNNDNLSKIYLYGKASRHGDILEQLASRQELATVKGILEAVLMLYWDTDKNRPKIGATNRNKIGNLRRFTGSIMPQFQMTYDLNSMSGKDILNLLPREFDEWK